MSINNSATVYTSSLSQRMPDPITHPIKTHFVAGQSLLFCTRELHLFSSQVVNGIRPSSTPVLRLFV